MGQTTAPPGRPHDLGSAADLLSVIEAMRVRMRELEQRHHIDRVALEAIRHNPFDAIWALDRAREVLFVNDRFGVPRHGGLARSTDLGAFLFAPAVLASLEPYYERAFAGEEVRFELEIDEPDGLHHHDVSMVPIREGARIETVAAFSRDVTALVRARESALAGEARLRSVIESSAAGVLLLSEVRSASGEILEFTIVDLNAPMAAFLNADAASLRGTPFLQTYAAAQRFGDKLLAVARGAAAETFDLVLGHEAGARAYRARIARVPAGLVLSVVDVTEQRVLQQRLALDDRLAALGRLAAGVAHELNNPLTWMLGNLEDLREWMDAKEDPAAKRLVEETLEGAERLRAIVQDLRIGSTPAPDPQELDVAPTILAALRMAAHAVPPHAHVDLDLEPALPRVRADSARLAQVLLNLLLNAAHAVAASERGDAHVLVTARAVEGAVAIKVRDTGCGMDPSTRDRLFEPFFTERRASGGTGLGLWLCRQIITGYGGTIEVESVRHQGTTVTICLPSAGAALGPPTARPGTRPIETRRRVLVIDDEPLLGRSLRRMLSAHEVVLADDALAALDRIDRGEPFDVVLCDLTMPGFDGMQVLEHLERAHRSLLPRLVMMSGGTSPAIEHQLRRRGIPLLAKPFPRDELLRTVARVSEGEP